jgi:hypothetical protein
MTEVPPQTTAPELIEPVLVPPKGLVATVVGLLLATAFAAVWFAPPLQGTLQPSLRLDFWRQSVDLEQLRARDDGLLRMKRDLAAEQDLLSRFRAYLHDEARLGTDALADQPAAREALGEIEERVRALVASRGQDALRAMAVAYGREVRAALEAALLAARQKHQALGTFMRDGSGGPAQALRDVAGGLGPALAGTGLDGELQGQRLLPAAGQVVEALAQTRILQLGQRIPTGPPPLPSDAQLLLLRFRIEAHEGLSNERKLRLVDELAIADPGAPVEYLRAVLLARAGQWRQARGLFLQAAARGQAPNLARVNASWCAKQGP